MIPFHSFTKTSLPALTAAVRRQLATTIAAREHAKNIDARTWSKLPEGDWLRQDPKTMRRTSECKSVAALQDLSEIVWDPSVTGPTARKELLKRVKAWETTSEMKANQQPAAAWRMLVAVRKAFYLATSNLDAADAVARALAECRGRSDISSVLQSASPEDYPGKKGTFEDTMEDLSSVPMQRRTFSEQPIVVLNTEEVHSTEEVIHDDQVAFRAPRATAVRDKRVPDVRVDILSGSLIGSDPDNIQARERRMVFATNLPFGVTREDIAHALGNVGRIVDVEIFSGRASTADSISDSSQSFASFESRITALIEFETEQAALQCRSNVTRLFGVVCTSADDVSNRVMRLEPAIFKRTLMITRVAWQYMLSEVLEKIGNIITEGTDARVEMRVRNAPIFEIPDADLSKPPTPLTDLRVTCESASTVAIHQDPSISVDKALRLESVRKLEALEGSLKSDNDATVETLTSTRWFVQDQLNDGIFCLRFPTFADTYTAMKRLTQPGVVLLGDKIPQVEFSAKSLSFVASHVEGVNVGDGISGGIYVDFLLPERSAKYTNAGDTPLSIDGIPSIQMHA
ncbi:hypothetical protein FOL47_004877 [Perkinsus chesapeaki]|uniref:RRM domain-containing protein n=1 Tax=Perkinsus chesapeaki TaxID=330153 RepID=A0A7J6M0B2_PERCH|nr:hypothetical protein FOL47_004877 [Perkinsus chesapeaki]